MLIELKYVMKVRTRHNKTIYYFRLGRGQNVRLPGDPLSRDFMEAYWEAIARHPEAETDKPKVSLKKKAMIVAPTGVRAQMRAAAKDGGAVYFVQGTETGHIKIGFSTNVMSRIGSLATGSGEKLRLLGAIKGTVADEKALHARFAKHHRKGEWFTNDFELLSYIKMVGADPANKVIQDSWAHLSGGLVL